MDSWTPATKEQVLEEIGKVAAHAGPEIWAQYSQHLVEPYAASIERFGQVENAFVVAKLPFRVVFYDDVEEDFGTATEVDGKLVDCAMYGDLRLCIKEAFAGA